MKMVALTAVVVVLGLVGLFIYKSQASDNAASEASSVASAVGAPVEAAKGSDSKAADSQAGGPFWAKRCEEPKDGKVAHCEVFQQITAKKTNQRFMEVAFAYPDKPEKAGDLNAVVIMPLGIVVAAGGTLQAGQDPEGKKFQILTCGQGGCLARFVLDGAFVQKIREAKTLTVGMVEASGKKLNVQLPLEGFDKALSSIKP